MLKRDLYLIALILISTSTLGQTKSGWIMTFNDEFDEPSLDTSKWAQRYAWGEMLQHNERQAYVDDALEFEEGIIIIRADTRDAYYDGALMDYTSGLISTHPSFEQLYGWFEIRCKLPAGQGFWPAFWLVDTDYSPEIDMLELLGHEPDRVYFALHTSVHETRNYKGPDFSEDFHVFNRMDRNRYNQLC